MVSIILTAYIQNKMQAHMTMACLANLSRYTDSEDYELILMSDSEKFPVRDEYKVLKVDKYIRTEGESYTQAMNHGASESTGDILVFLQNDVFVYEGWLKNMRYYIEKGLADCVIPDQCPRDRGFVKKSYEMTMEEGMKYGSRDAGCLMITREAFVKAGRWNEDLTLLADGDFYKRMADNGVNQIDTCKVMITHIAAATNLDRPVEEYDKLMKADADKVNI